MPRASQRLDRAYDVVGLDRDVLHARPGVVLEVLRDLALAAALRRLVDRELDLALAVRHHLRHQRRVLGVNLLVVVVDDVLEPEHVLVPPDPLVHLPELDVADAMVEQRQADTAVAGHPARTAAYPGRNGPA